MQDVDQINIIADVPGNSPSATTNAGRKTGGFTRKRVFRSSVPPLMSLASTPWNLPQRFATKYLKITTRTPVSRNSASAGNRSTRRLRFAARSVKVTVNPHLSNSTRARYRG